MLFAQELETTMETSLLPISMNKHIVFACVAAVFFLLQFIRTKQWYQLIMAAAIPLSLLIYIDEENMTLFYGVGILEAVLLCSALVMNIVQSHKQNQAEKAAEEAKKAAESAAAPAAETPTAAEAPAEPAAETPAAEEAPAEPAAETPAAAETTAEPAAEAPAAAETPAEPAAETAPAEKAEEA